MNHPLRIVLTGGSGASGGRGRPHQSRRTQRELPLYACQSQRDQGLADSDHPFARSGVTGLAHPPRLWMNASTATIYRHALDRPMDEATGEIGGHELNAPSTWRFSIDVATSWEEAFFSSVTPETRKVALRSAMIMSPDRGGIFGELLRLVRLGLGGTAGSGQQFVSWIHGEDFLGSIEYLMAHEECAGAFNLASPNPLPNREFMRVLRRAWERPWACPPPPGCWSWAHGSCVRKPN